MFARGRSGRRPKTPEKKRETLFELPPTRLTAKMFKTIEPQTITWSIEEPPPTTAKNEQSGKIDYHQARTFQNIGNFEDAIKHYDTALKINPQFYEAWCGKGTSLNVLYSTTRNNRLLSEAINCFNNASKIQPQYTEAWYNKGLCLAKLGASTRNENILNEAVSCFDYALKINPRFAAGLYGKGITLDSFRRINSR